MHKTFLFTSLALALCAQGVGAHATDLNNLDETGYELTVTANGESKTLEVAPLSNVDALCDGCVLTLADGQSVEAPGDATISIVDGKLISDAN